MPCQLSLNATVGTQWEKLRTELHPVAEAFNVPESYRSRPGAA